MDTLRIVPCPCCRSVLYMLTPAGPGSWRLTKDSPPIRSEGGRRFMKCARCHNRIELTLADELPSPGFAVAAEQDCSC